MAVKTSWSSGDVLTAADLTDTFAAKGDIAGETWTGTHDFSGATVSGIGGGLTLLEPTSIAYSGTSASTSGGVTTFSACTSVSLNGVFTATHANYLVLFRGSQTADAFVYLRLRASGSDASGANYARQNLNASGGSAFPGNGTDTHLTGAYGANTNWYSSAILQGPYLAGVTGMESRFGHQGGYLGHYQVVHNLSTSYDGMSLIASGGTITGNVRVYGYEGA